MDNTLILIYAIYGTVAIGLVVWLARVLEGVGECPPPEPCDVPQPGGSDASGYNFAVAGLENGLARTLDQLASRPSVTIPQAFETSLVAAGRLLLLQRDGHSASNDSFQVRICRNRFHVFGIGHPWIDIVSHDQTTGTKQRK